MRKARIWKLCSRRFHPGAGEALEPQPGSLAVSSANQKLSRNGLRVLEADFWRRNFRIADHPDAIGTRFLLRDGRAFADMYLAGDAEVASSEVVAAVYAGFNLVAALISYLSGSLSDKWGRRNILLLSFIIFFVAYVGFARTRNVAVIAALFVGYGLFQGIFRSVGKAFASDFVPERLRASALGWYSTTIGLLSLVASVVAGVLWDRVGHAAVFYYGAIFAVAGTVGLLSLPRRERNEPALLKCDEARASGGSSGESTSIYPDDTSHSVVGCLTRPFSHGDETALDHNAREQTH